MNSCCTIYHIDPEELGTPVQVESEECVGCNCHCGYIQFESLAPYLTKITRVSTQDEDHIVLEARLRQQIVEVSRLLDLETKATPGAYSKAHYKVIKVYGDGSRYLKIPEFVAGTLEVYTLSGYKVNPDSYTYKDGLLIFNPCESHTSSCGCTNACGIYQPKRIPSGWKGCLQVKAKFGQECADYAVQMAVRDYLIEHNTFGDIKQQVAEGITIRSSFKRPDSWETVVNQYLNRRKFPNQFAFA